MQPEPFVDCRAFSKAASTYVPFSTPSDAILASLFLCHQMPRNFMDIVISVATHPNFDAKHVTLKDTVDIIQIEEQARLQVRLVDAHRRSLDADGQINRTNVPEVILDGVLDVLHTERQSELSSLAGDLGWHSRRLDGVEAGAVFFTMSLVHRSWTFPAQKALGRILCVHNIIKQARLLSSQVHTSIFGAWTSHFILLIHGVFSNEHSSAYDWCMEAWHNFLLRLTTLKRIQIKVSGVYAVEWTQSVYTTLARQNPSLEKLDLQAPMDEWRNSEVSVPISLNGLVQNLGKIRGLQYLNVHRGRLSLTSPYLPTQEIDLPYLRRLSYNCESGEDIRTFTTLLSTLSSSTNMQLDTLSVVDLAMKRDAVAANFDPNQSVAAWTHIRKLCVASVRSLDLWIGKAAPLCESISEIHLQTHTTASPEVLSSLPRTIRRLEVCLAMPRFTRDFSLVTGWAINLSSILNSRRYADLKSITLEVPNCGDEFTGFINDETRKYKDDITQYAEELNSICNNLGVQFTLEWEQRGAYALPEIWEADADEQEGWFTEEFEEP